MVKMRGCPHRGPDGAVSAEPDEPHQGDHLTHPHDQNESRTGWHWIQNPEYGGLNHQTHDERPQRPPEVPPCGKRHQEYELKVDRRDDRGGCRTMRQHSPSCRGLAQETEAPAMQDQRRAYRRRPLSIHRAGVGRSPSDQRYGHPSASAAATHGSKPSPDHHRTDLKVSDLIGIEQCACHEEIRIAHEPCTQPQHPVRPGLPQIAQQARADRYG